MLQGARVQGMEHDQGGQGPRQRLLISSRKFVCRTVATGGALMTTSEATAQPRSNMYT